MITTGLMMSTLRVCIPTAGTGSRLNKLTKHLNKSLVDVSNKPVISHIIDSYPSNTEFVIALGYKGDLVKEFLDLAYPKKKFFFVEIDIFTGKNSGLGYTLNCCKEYLQSPFIFHSCDTIVTNKIPSPHIMNWIGYSSTEDSSNYRTLKIINNKVLKIQKKNLNKKKGIAYIGIAGIKDYKQFWESMDSKSPMVIREGESYGLNKIINNFKPVSFNWYDTGIPHLLERARYELAKKKQPTILSKETEAIWFVGKKVIKFSTDKNFIKNRVIRSKDISDFIPKIISSRTNMYSYKKAEGKIFSECSSIDNFKKLLNISENFWQKKDLPPDKFDFFKKRCLFFYKNKTQERINLYFKKFSRSDSKKNINSIKMPLISSLLNKIDWDELSDGIPVRFHGDFHFENILFDDKNCNFYFLDWRQDFAGIMNYGDIYYDFAKLMHGLIVNHEIINKNLFSIDEKVRDINFEFLRKNSLIECQNYFENWITSRKFNLRKIYLLTAIIYLNIAALHHKPYCHLLFNLGKQMLYKYLNIKLIK